MLKKFLMILGIILLIITTGFGVRAFIDRREQKKLKSNIVNSNSSTSNKAPQKPSFDKSANSLSDPSSIWVVVNKTRPLSPLEYAPTDLFSVGNGQQMRQEAANALTALSAAAKTEGLTLQADSGYRSYSYQVNVYGNEVKTKGQATADTESARPGYSEHQTGWAVDIGGGGCHIEDCFGTTSEGKWVAANAYKYGFIIRYTSEKQLVTGFRAEPWHIRYIGTQLAAEMHKEGVTTLEEFFNLAAAPDYK